ncbi:MAG: 5-formyltetrahydrofolate cyclo-ligase, partial [Oscillospiraceae bacterium]
MPLTKDEMRKNIKALTANGAITREISQAVCQNILSLNEFNRAKNVMGFMPKNDEIDITFVLKAILQSGKTLLLPKCEENGKMTAFAVASLEVLQKGAFGILEPPDFLEKAEKKNIEICLVPC